MNDSKTAVWRGQPQPLGATWDGEGVNFALFSEHADRVELCLFDPKTRRETERIAMRWQTNQVWHCYLPEARPGLLYGYRVHGPYDPKRGLRLNPNKLLLDPYAKQMDGGIKWSDALFGYRVGGAREDLTMDRRDDEGMVAKDSDAPYEEHRSSKWLKVKVHQEEEFVIGGFTAPAGARKHMGALLLGAYRGKDFIFVGKLAPGFPNRRSLHSRNRSAHSFVAARLSSSHLVRRTSPGLSRGWSRRLHVRNGQRTKSCASQSFWVCATTKGQANRCCQKNYKPHPLVRSF